MRGLGGALAEFAFTDALAGATIVHDPDTDELLVHKGDGSLPEVRSVFYPGCSMVNYAMPLIRRTYEMLLDAGAVDGMSFLCCGKILSYEQGGDELRSIYERDLIDRLAESSVERMVIACPNCMLALRNCLADDERTSGIELVTLPQMLVELGMCIDRDAIRRAFGGDKCTDPLLCIHDSCPDREFGEYAEGLRDILPEGSWVDPLHCRSRSVCCGSLPRAAGKIEAADRCADLNGTEAMQVSADAIVTSCMSCAFQLNAAQRHLPAVHFLELLHDSRIDWAAAPMLMKVRFLLDDFMGATMLDEETARRYASLDEDGTVRVLGSKEEDEERADEDAKAATSVTISNADTRSIVV